MPQSIQSIELRATITLAPTSPAFPGGQIVGTGPTLADARTSLLAAAQQRLDQNQGNVDLLTSLISGA